MKDSMKRVGSEGILTQVLKLSAVQQTYFVKAPSSFWHNYRWNHKLIRYIFKMLNLK